MGNICMNTMSLDPDADEYLMIGAPFQDLLENNNKTYESEQSSNKSSHIKERGIFPTKRGSLGARMYKAIDADVHQDNDSSNDIIINSDERFSVDESRPKLSSQDDLYVNVNYGGSLVGNGNGSGSFSVTTTANTTGSQVQTGTSGTPSSPMHPSRLHNMYSPRRRQRSASFGSQSDAGDSSYGWFEDTDSPMVSYSKELNSLQISHQQRAVPASDTPLYILETELETQKLWHQTAGRRPKQPENERKYFEKLWEEQLQKSQAVKEARDNPSSITHNHSDVSNNNKDGTREEVLYKGRGPFSNAVTKAFDKDKNSFELLTLQLPRFKIKKDIHGSTYCCYLVVIAVNGISYGVWKRYSEFEAFAKKIESINAGDLNSIDKEDLAVAAGSKNAHMYGKPFNNSILSWQCLLNKKNWFRCIDKDYIALKCFLLERFMHDILFESNSPDLLFGFLSIKSIVE